MVVISQDIPAKILHRQLEDCNPELLAPVTCESPIASVGGFLPQFDGKRMEKTSKTRPAAFPWVSHEPSHSNQSFGKEESFLN